jgi:molybdopterin converting factor small subunit
MIIEKIKVINYKIFKEKTIELNSNINIFVGENDAGKSTILEIINLITNGKINGYNIDRQITSNVFNFDVRKAYINKVQNGEFAELPSIIIEAYCKQDNNSSYKGTNNSLGEDCPGISFYCRFNSDNASAYKEKLANKEIVDIPLEFYETKFFSFKGDGIVPKYLPFKVANIDTSKKDYSNLINKFISENMEQFLSDEDKMNLRSEYRKNNMNFKNIDSIKQLNTKLKENVKINDKK